MFIGLYSQAHGIIVGVMANKVEILAPAGDMTCLQAALDAGADAVYFGLGEFNMRQRAGINFTVADLPKIKRRAGNEGSELIDTVAEFLVYVHMRKNRVIEQNRCYHLVSRLAHRAFFLDDEEKRRTARLR